MTELSYRLCINTIFPASCADNAQDEIKHEWMFDIREPTKPVSISTYPVPVEIAPYLLTDAWTTHHPKPNNVAICRYMLTFTDILEQNYDVTTSHQRILQLATERGLIRPRDLAEYGLPRVALTRLVRQGLLHRVGRGLYAIPDRASSEHGSLAEVARKHPQVIVCLLTALRVHNLTTQSPFEVWLAIPNKARAPKIDFPPLRVVRFSGASLTDGIEDIQIDGVAVRVTNIARTVTDCFKFRNKIGLDVAMEALQEAWREKRISMDELWHYAAVCRVTNVMRPYMESLT